MRGDVAGSRSQVLSMLPIVFGSYSPCSGSKSTSDSGLSCQLSHCHDVLCVRAYLDQNDAANAMTMESGLSLASSAPSACCSS